MGKDFSALRSSSGQNLTAICGLHSFSEAMHLASLPFFRLESTQHIKTSFNDPNTWLTRDKDKTVLKGKISAMLCRKYSKTGTGFLCFSALPDQKFSSFKTAAHLKTRKNRVIFGAKDNGGLTPAEDNKPKSADFFRLSGVLSLSWVSLVSKN